MDRESLNEMYEYKDGELYHKRKVINISVGDVAGWKAGNGYQMVGYKGGSIYSHRAIFLMHHGYLPDIVDHVDRDISNNRIENLRAATKAQNAWNSKLFETNTSGVRGVYWHKARKTWNAGFLHNKKKIHVGVFKTFEEAVAAINAARQKHYGEYVGQ